MKKVTNKLFVLVLTVSILFISSSAQSTECRYDSTTNEYVNQWGYPVSPIWCSNIGSLVLKKYNQSLSYPHKKSDQNNSLEVIFKQRHPGESQYDEVIDFQL